MCISGLARVFIKYFLHRYGWFKVISGYMQILQHAYRSKSSQIANFEAFTVVMFHVEAFWVVMPCSFFTLKMESSWISETLMLYHNATSRSQHRRPRLET